MQTCLTCCSQYCPLPVPCPLCSSWSSVYAFHFALQDISSCLSAAHCLCCVILLAFIKRNPAFGALPSGYTQRLDTTIIHVTGYGHVHMLQCMCRRWLRLCLPAFRHKKGWSQQRWAYQWGFRSGSMAVQASKTARTNSSQWGVHTEPRTSIQQ